jgi:hypothetical protein
MSMWMRHLTRVTLGLVLVGALGCGSDESDGEAGKTPATQPQDVEPMPHTGHVIAWGTPGVPCQIKAGSIVPVSVIVTNGGDQVWRDVASSGTGRGAVRLGARWWHASPAKAPLIDYTAARGDLSGPVSPGGSARLTVDVVAPTAPGSYMLQLDLVEELVVWFEYVGAAKLMVPVTVTP